MKTWAAVAAVVVAVLGGLAVGQTPTIFDVSDVVAGAQRIDTRYFYATGKWSDDGNEAGINSVEIHCYKRFGFCEVAHAYSSFGKAWVSLDSFDILRWDNQELIAVDSSPICVVNTLRADFTAKKVSISSTSKAETRDKFCTAMYADPATFKTAFLMGWKDEFPDKKNGKQ
jgi:hypothetical protein